MLVQFILIFLIPAIIIIMMWACYGFSQVILGFLLALALCWPFIGANSAPEYFNLLWAAVSKTPGWFLYAWAGLSVVSTPAGFSGAMAYLAFEKAIKK